MSPLIKKEIRLLLPAWTAAMLLATVPTWVAAVWSRVPSEVNGYVECAFALGILFLSIASFGEEFSSGAFSIFLSQPMDRRRMWRIKTTVLGTAFTTVLLAATISWNLDLFIRTARAPDFLTELGFSGLFLAVMFSSGLWATLLLRRMSEAFWLTLLTPVAIVVGLYGLHVLFGWSGKTDNRVIPPVLLLYSVAGFFWARRMFLRAQDVQWTGGEIIFPSHKRNSDRTMVSGRRCHWFSALVWKEIQLHQVNLLIAGIVLVLNLASVLIRKFHPHFTDQNIEGFLELVWALWLLMPLLIGSVAVAEEHRGGTFESQLCLPVSRRVQLAVKFFVALVLSLFLGGGMPLLIERTLNINLWIFAVAGAIFFISFYASTVSRTTLQAIGLAIVVGGVFYSYEVATAISIFKLGGVWTHERVGLELLKLYVGPPILVLTLAVMMCWNFKWLHAEAKLRWRNGIAILASLAFVFLVTNSVYFRVWEFLTPTPSPSGPARLSASNPPKSILLGNAFSVLLPDGRLWINPLGWAWEMPAPNQYQAKFVGGSNWTAIASGWVETAIQSNGSLWCVPVMPVGPEQLCQIGEPAQIGSQTNWRGVAGGMLVGGGVLLLKNDGTLWNWETNWASRWPQMLTLQLATPPVQVGSGTDWVSVFSSGECASARQSNGSVWNWEPTWTNAAFHLVRATNSTFVVNYGRFFLGNNANQMSGSAEIRNDGKLWFSWYELTNNVHVGAGKIQLGQGSKWKGTGFARRSLLALRSDGTLWRWKPLSELASRHQPVAPVQMGNYSDWIALKSGEFGPGQSRTFSLAADGSIWVWGEPSRHIWLAPSRKPVYLGNIFSGR